MNLVKYERGYKRAYFTSEKAALNFKASIEKNKKTLAYCDPCGYLWTPFVRINYCSGFVVSWDYQSTHNEH